MLLQNLYDQFGEDTCFHVRSFININQKLLKAIKKKEYLQSCKQDNIYNRKVIHITNSIHKMHFHINTIRKRANKVAKNLKITLLNVEIKDIHFHLNFLNKKYENSKNKLKSILPEDQ